VFLDLSDVLGCEAADRLTYVHSSRGRFDLDLTLSAIGACFGRSLIRVHRNWLLNPARVLELVRESGEVTAVVGLTTTTAARDPLKVPVSRDKATELRALLMADATGVRRF
jgi:DNA-binding LytR/AlgR family response regulator